MAWAKLAVPGVCNPADDTYWHPEKLLRAEDDEW
jgi:hypothetical protein